MTTVYTPSSRPAREIAGPAPVRRPRFAVSLLTLAGLVAAIGAIGLVALYVSLPAAALIYAAAYMLLAWVRPDLALFLMFASCPFLYDVGGGPVKMALAEIDLVLATPILLVRTLWRRQPLTSNPIKWPLLAYFGICIASSLRGGITAEGIVSMAQMAIYMVLAVFVFSSCVPDLRLNYIALYGFLLSCAFLAVLGVTTRQEYLLGIHKNAIGTSLSNAVIICGELWFAESDRRRKRRLGLLACLLVGGLFFSVSRGGWAGALAGLAVIAAMRRQFKLLFRAMVPAALIVVILWQLLPRYEQEYAADLQTTSHNVKARLISIEYAMHFFETSPVLGVGVGLRKLYDATNLVVSTLAETGVLGLIAFLSIFVALAWSIWRARSRIPLTHPMFSFLAIGLALTACQFLHGLVDHYWSRVLLVPWATVGMAFRARQEGIRTPR